MWEAILQIGAQLSAVADRWMQKSQQAHDEENGAGKITVINQQKVIEDVQIAQHVEHDVSFDGPLANWVREREAKSGS